MMHFGTLILLVFLKLPQENLANVQHSISESQGATDQFKDGFAIRSGDLLESVLQPLIDQLYQQISCHTATISLFTRDLRKQVGYEDHETALACTDTLVSMDEVMEG